MNAPHCAHCERDFKTKWSLALRKRERVFECFLLGCAMMLLLLGFHFFYDDWGSMIAIFLTIARAFIEIDAAMGAKSPAACFAQMHQRMFDDQEFAHILKRLDRILP